MSKIEWTNRKVLLIVLSIFLILIVSLTFLRLSGSGEQQDLAVYSVYQVRATDPLIFDGKVQAEYEQEEYVDPSLGVIAEIAVEDGEVVEKDAVLFTYSNEENQQLLEEQNRQHARLTTRLSEAKTELANAQKAFETAQASISEKNRQIGNHTPQEETEFSFDQELESLETELVAYEADKAEAAISIESTEMNIRELEEQLEDVTAEIERIRTNITTSIEARISGTVELNDSVANRPDFSEEPLIRILSDSVIVEATISEYDYNEINSGDAVNVLLLNSDEVVNGEIISIDSRPLASMNADDSSSRYRFTVMPSESIQYGFSVQVSYQDGTIHVPESALTFEEDETYIFVHEEGVVHRRKVSVRKDGNVYVLEEGLSVDEEIILDPLSELEDGEEVVVIDD